MSAALFYVDALPGAGELAVVDGDEGFHASNVRRIRVGEQIDLSDGAGVLAHCVVEETAKGRLSARVTERGHHRGPAPDGHRGAGAAQIRPVRAGRRAGDGGRCRRLCRLAGDSVRGPLGRPEGGQGPAALGGGGSFGGPPVAPRVCPRRRRRGLDGGAHSACRRRRGSRRGGAGVARVGHRSHCRTASGPSGFTDAHRRAGGRDRRRGDRSADRGRREDGPRWARRCCARRQRQPWPSGRSVL